MGRSISGEGELKPSKRKINALFKISSQLYWYWKYQFPNTYSTAGLCFGFGFFFKKKQTQSQLRENWNRLCLTDSVNRINPAGAAVDLLQKPHGQGEQNGIKTWGHFISVCVVTVATSWFQNLRKLKQMNWSLQGLQRDGSKSWIDGETSNVTVYTALHQPKMLKNNSSLFPIIAWLPNLKKKKKTATT